MAEIFNQFFVVSEATRSSFRGRKFQSFLGGARACPQTPLVQLRAIIFMHVCGGQRALVLKATVLSQSYGQFSQHSLTVDTKLTNCFPIHFFNEEGIPTTKSIQ